MLHGRGPAAAHLEEVQVRVQLAVVDVALAAGLGGVVRGAPLQALQAHLLAPGAHMGKKVSVCVWGRQVGGWDRGTHGEGRRMGLGGRRTGQKEVDFLPCRSNLVLASGPLKGAER